MPTESVESRADAYRKLASRPALVFSSLAAGAALGLLAPAFAMDIGVFGDIYVDLLKMIILPFMVTAVIFSLRQLIHEGGATRMLGRVAVLLVAATVAAGLIGLLAAVVIAPGSHLSSETLLTLSKLVGEDLNRTGHTEMALFGNETTEKALTFGEMVLALIPSNIFAALAQGDTLKALVFSLLFGLAIGQVPLTSSLSLTHTLETIYQACLKLTHWFNYMLPLVIFSMVASQVARTGLEPMRAMLKFLFALSAAALVIIALSIWLLRWASRLPWHAVLRSQREPLTMAIATRSSAACMPAMIESLTDHLHFPRTRIELLVPLGVSLLRLGPVLYYVIATFFIAQMYGRELQAAEIAVVVIGSMLAGFASSGMSGFVIISLTGVVCAYIHLPFEAALALFLAIDPICDMLRTVVLVASNNAFAALACKRTASA
ncbi:MAG: cation:dicarboxylase symporter family transporter [Sulfuricella sp.]|nr:cation:dicarboxylase symporter family transporter [Sulfuricella sp.]